MQAFKLKLIFLACAISMISCTSLDRRTTVVSVSGKQESEKLLKISNAKSDIIIAKQSLKLAIIKLNLMSKHELRDNKGLRKAVFIEARALSPIVLEKRNSPFHLFKGDPIFTKLIPEFYQFMDALEYRKIPLIVDCSEVPDCSSLKSNLKKQYKLRVSSLADVLKGNRHYSYIVMLSSRNIALENDSSVQFRTAFKHKWLSFPLLYRQGLQIEEWANLIPKVKEF